MAGIIDYINQARKKFQFLKWVQIIPQESLATKKSALYFVEKNETEVDAIVIDDLGQKRKLTGGGITIDLKNHTHSYNDLTDLPPNQNIDSVVTIGAVTATTNNVNLALHFSGVNRVYIGGENYYKITEDNFSFTPVTTGIKVLLIYALPDSQIFYLAEGIESTQAVEPTGLPTNALLVARLIASTTGVIISIEDYNYKQKSDDTIETVILTDDNPYWSFGSRTNYDIIATGAVTSPILAGFKYNDSTGGIWNGKKSLIRNRTGLPLLLKKTTAPIDTLIYFTFKNNVTVPDGKDVFIVYDNNNEVAIVEIGSSGGGVGATKTSELTNDGEDGLNPFITANDVPAQIPQVNSDWDAMSGLAEILNKPTIPAPVDLSGYATTAQLATKLTKPATAGTFAVQYDGTNYSYVAVSGENISNANMTWEGNTTQNLGGFKVSFTNGRFSVPALEMEVKSSYAIASSVWFDGVALWLNPTVGASRRFNAGTTFNYTPTGNFTLSAVKNAMEAAGYNFNDSNVNIILGANNYTCSIDIGAANIGKALTIERTGTGSISFSSTRTLDSGVDAITIMNGNEMSMVRIRFGTSKDFIIIRNL